VRANAPATAFYPVNLSSVLHVFLHRAVVKDLSEIANLGTSVQRIQGAVRNGEDWEEEVGAFALPRWRGVTVLVYDG